MLNLKLHVRLIISYEAQRETPDIKHKHQTNWSYVMKHKHRHKRYTLRYWIYIPCTIEVEGARPLNRKEAKNIDIKINGLF
jgi:hypothetical protein